ncbi:MAG: winged helix-turn-helix domain-containing protein [Candidatus Sulfotelmatobacter sp.]
MFLKDSQSGAISSLTSSLYAFGEIRVDVQNRVLRRGEEPIALTPKAFDVLMLLMQHSGEVVSKDELIQSVWPDSFVEESNLTQTVFMLRKALGETSSHRYILTIQGRGYRFVPEVKAVSAIEPVSDTTSASVAARAERASLSSAPQTFARPIRRRTFFAFALLAVVAIGLALGLWPVLSRRANASSPLGSVAVLPLANFSGDASQEYFVDGMTDELITELAKVSSLRVISRTSTMRYKGTKKSLPEIARELNVDGIVEGSVTRSGGRIRITAQLIRAPSDQHIWAESYERDLGDVLRLQNDVAEAITQQVRARLSPQQQARLHPLAAVNPAAYDAYLRGRYHLVRNPEAAKGYFEEAIRKDPRFAPAYAGLAEAYFGLGSLRQVGPGRANRFAEEAAAKALELDEGVGEAHTILAVLKWRYDWDIPAAEREFASALALAPNYDCLHSYYASYLGSRGRRAEAMAEISTARELSPSISFDTDEASAEYQLGDYGSLVASSQHGLSLEPDSWLDRYFLGVGYQGLGKPTMAVPEFEKAVKLSNGDQDATAALAYAYVTTGRRAEARKILHDFQQQSRSTYVSPYMTATIYAGLGDKGRAFNFLEKAFQERSLDLVWNLKTDPRVDGLRSDPRFQDLLRRIGIN